MPQEFLDFELSVDPAPDGYTVSVVRSPAGEAKETVAFPFNASQLELRLKDLEIALLRSSGGPRRKVSTKEEASVKALGSAFFDFLLPRTVGSLFYESRREAERRGRGLRLKLRMDAPELAALPWEFLHDPRHDDYLCLASDTPLVRYLPVAQSPRPLTVTPPLRILGMVASPHGYESLDVALEKQQLETALATLQADGLVELTWLEGGSWRALQREMRRSDWHIFHFIGHGGFDKGRDEGFLAFADERGEAERIYAGPLARLLDKGSLRLALLNACDGAKAGQLDIFSSTAAALARRSVPAVLAMQYEISDEASLEFSRSFYEALAEGLPVDAAVTEARRSLSFAQPNSVEWGTPVLYLRAADGALFAWEDSPAEAQRRGGAERQKAKREGKSGGGDFGVSAPEGQSLTDGPPSPGSIGQPRAVNASAGRGAGGEGQMPAVIVRPPIEFDWVTIPAGEFVMGSDKKADSLARDDEMPQHTLFLPEYRIARVPVTNAQYARFVKAANYQTPQHWTNGKIPDGKAEHPVVCVSWNDAIAFCEWAGVQLPSEAEWEKAARGTDGHIWPWGNQPPDKTRCNFNRNVGDTTPVGDYPAGASPYGVLDMAGNAWEWCRTKWRVNYEGYVKSVSGDLTSDGLRVLRGGSWHGASTGVRAALRNGDEPDYRNNYVGFRLVAPGL